MSILEGGLVVVHGSSSSRTVQDDGGCTLPLPVLWSGATSTRDQVLGDGSLSEVKSDRQPTNHVAEDSSIRLRNQAFLTPMKSPPTTGEAHRDSGLHGGRIAGFSIEFHGRNVARLRASVLERHELPVVDADHEIGPAVPIEECRWG